MVIEARRRGFEQNFVIKAAPSGPVSWDIPVRTKGLSAKAESDGSVSFVDDKGKVVSAIPAPSAWDAKVDPASKDHLNVSAVKLTVTQKSKGRAVLTVTPDASWLGAKGRLFPVTVDPAYGNVSAGFRRVRGAGLHHRSVPGPGTEVGQQRVGSGRAVVHPVLVRRGYRLAGALGESEPLHGALLVVQRTPVGGVADRLGRDLDAVDEPAVRSPRRSPPPPRPRATAPHAPVRG